MPDPSLLEVFPTPVDSPFVIEHINEEFTSLCPKTGHPDFGRIILHYSPAKLCVELKSLNRIRDDLAKAMAPRWLQVITEWKGRGGIHSRIIATSGTVPPEWARG